MTGRPGRGARGRIVAFSGPSGVGKTTLLVELIPALVERGLRVAALKRSGHPHAFDRPGKDSDRLRRAGALAVALQGPAEIAYFGPPVGGPAELASLLPPVDLVLAEGFKDEALPRVEVHRASVAREFLSGGDPHAIAVVSDEEPPLALPWFEADEVEALAEFLARYAREGGRARGRALVARRPGGHRVLQELDQDPESSMARRTSRARAAARPTRGAAPRANAAKRRSGATKGRSGGAKGRRGGGATVREAGRKGGRRTLERRGPEFYSRIGRKGGKASGAGRSAAARARRQALRAADHGGARRSGGRAGARTGTARRSSSRAR